MSKKLKLSEIKLKSFVTKPGKLTAGGEEPPTYDILCKAYSYAPQECGPTQAIICTVQAGCGGAYTCSPQQSNYYVDGVCY